ncbi:MAG: oligopeptide/dipeptide ABC transporter ATP-binding protein [Acutalibacteraceae bacterium]
MVESAPARHCLRIPAIRTQRRCLSAIPVPDPDFKMERIPLKGELTSPDDPEPGCRFAKRCPYATEGCTSNEMTAKEMEPGHFVKLPYGSGAGLNSGRNPGRSLPWFQSII